MVETDNQSSDYYENAVFVSYAWGGESERTVDDLEQALAEHGIQIVRDKKDLDYKGSIEAFEQRIGHGQCIALIISDKYLRSEHCMYELVEIDKNRNLRSRIFPIVLADARIFTPIDRLNYIRYWDEQIGKLNQALKEVTVMTNLVGIMADLDKYAGIRASFDHLTDLLSDLNVLTPKSHADSGYSTIISAVKRAIVRNPATSQLNKVTYEADTISESTSGRLSNPFIYGRPVRPDEFINRASELHTVFNRLHNSESTGIVGEPHIGKTSFLKQLMDKDTQKTYLGDEAQHLVFSRLDFHYINSEFTPMVFWEKAVKPLRQLPNRDSFAWKLEALGENHYANDSLVEFFEYFDQQGDQLILLLDEFDVLLRHPNFQEFAFYATLRAVAACSSCSIVLASRNSLTELQNYINKLPYGGGSPALNFLMELRLRPFDDRSVEELLARAGDIFSSDDKHIIRCAAGHHPFLVQSMAANLVESRDLTSRQSAIERFCNLTCSHFDDLWISLPDRERATVIVLGLVECGKCKFGDKFDYSEIQALANLGAGLHVLRDLGLAQRVNTSQLPYRRFLVWQGEQWTLATQAFVCWVYQVTVAKTHHLSDFNDWIRNERYVSLLSSDQWGRLVDRVHWSVGPQICNIGLMIENRIKHFA